MDDLKDYIPLIIIVASFVFSAIKNAGKKPKQEETGNTLPPNMDREKVDWKEASPVSRPYQQSTIDSALQEFKSEHIVKKGYDVWAENESDLQEVVAFNPIVVSSLKESSFYEEDESQISEEVGLVSSINVDLKDQDELKKAIIYTEILQQKYS
jgi:hypothetical protein